MSISDTLKALAAKHEAPAEPATTAEPRSTKPSLVAEVRLLSYGTFDRRWHTVDALVRAIHQAAKTTGQDMPSPDEIATDYAPHFLRNTKR